ncbi:hypothetical protein TGAM01_v204271 [Trichoderma gamsii]|uniref:Oxidoreductase acuF-like C2H2 type zinc-finger domain-containing protein n=1 Tax=Trichoderma gamsii TaxID=398673 RepID=A0A2P4ZR34_9HYPO|nr:hypothetical protein TGAM01_v204271 [Trichoderma gamsii]PON26770.1 hypothetical protein TGAM01_v204271 [Trichoderma gamsii]
MNSLFRLSMLIRKLSPRDRFKQALLASDLPFSDSHDIDYVRNKYSKLANSPLSMRLGSGIAKRRNFIKYCRDHRSRLGMDEANIYDATDTELLSSKATTFAPLPAFNSSLQEEEEDDNFSLASASTMATSISNLKLPTLADLAPTDQPFECPICFTIQAFRSENSWKLHAFHDLKAYVCTLGGDECDAEFFEDRDSWFDHELRKHRSQYSCILCQSGGFSLIALQAHILKAHGDFSDAQIEILQEEGRENITQFEAQSCPFCDDWAEKLLQKSESVIHSFGSMQGILVNHNRFKRHVASHQEQLAIFAVPRAKEDEDLSNSGSIIDSDATPTDVAMDEDERQDSAVDRENVFEQDTNDAPSDVPINPSTTSKDEVLNEQETKNLTEVGNKNSKEAQAAATVHYSSEGTMRSPNSGRPIARNRETPSIPYGPNFVFRRPWRGQVHTWTCCRCGTGGMVYDTTRTCLEMSCQHGLCPNCAYYTE